MNMGDLGYQYDEPWTIPASVKVQHKDGVSEFVFVCTDCGWAGRIEKYADYISIESCMC